MENDGFITRITGGAKRKFSVAKDRFDGFISLDTKDKLRLLKNFFFDHAMLILLLLAIITAVVVFIVRIVKKIKKRKRKD